MTNTRCWILVAGIVLIATPAVAQLEDVEWLRPCRIGIDRETFCGMYDVWENRTTRSGRRIGINVVIVTARSEAQAPDPLFHFSGGPGGAATQAARGMMRGYDAISQHRDVVFIDQRGTGRSSPLVCREPTGDDDLQAFFGEFLPENYVRECLASQTADVAQYTTPIAMDDIDEIRAALGYDEINLSGGSYGTRAAQVYMKRHPERVRAAVLHGVAPMDMENPLPFAKALDRGVQGVIDACLAETACGEAYPNLADDWKRSQQFFDNGRVSATVTHPASKKTQHVTIGKGTYADGVRHILYSVGASRRLPSMIHAAGQGDFDAFAQRELEQAIGFNEGLSMGMFMTVTCAEDLRFVSEEDIRRHTDGTFLGDYRVRAQLAACEIWGWGEGVGDDYQEPVRIDAPVLLISGEFDTATPADGAERAAAALPSGKHIVFPNQAHGYANFACETRIMADFIAAASFDGLDLACVAETRRPAFEIG